MSDEERKSRYELFLEDEARKAQPTKRCSKCGEVKALGEFHKDKSAMLGVMSACKRCRCDSKRKWKNRVDRFWKTYHTRTEHVGDCLEWTGEYKTQYPMVGWNGKPHRVVRVLYQLAIGELSDGEVITVTCHNYKCVRHSHLEKVSREKFYGILHNRAATGDRSSSRLYPDSRTRGDQHWSHTQRARFIAVYSKLTEDDVRAIRDTASSGNVSQRKLARMFKVSQGTIWRIIHRDTWKHVQ